MDGEPTSSTTAADDSEVRPEAIDSGTLLAEMRAKRMSRNAIIDELMSAGLTLDEATDAFDEDVPVRLERSGGVIRRLDPVPIPQPVAGIGGWLLLPAINLVILIVGLVRNLAEVSDLLNALDEQALVPAADRTAIVVGISVLGALLALAVITAWFFFRRHRWAPGLYIALILVGYAIVALVAVGMEVNPEEEGAPLLVPLAVWSVIWIAYFLRSERVRNTFTG